MSQTGPVDPHYAYPDHERWLHWDLTVRCNLDCDYCFTAGWRRLLARLSRARRTIPPIRITALLRTLERTGNTFLITFTGSGEPFLIPNLTEACKDLTRQHYVSVNSNLTLPRVQAFAQTIDPRRVFFIHASFHYQQLLARRLLDVYFRHFLLCRQKGFNIYGDTVAYPSLLREVDVIRGLFRDLGETVKFTPFIGTYRGKRYPDAYTAEERQGFGFTAASGGMASASCPRLCNAGYNVGAVHPSGRVTLCCLRRRRIGSVYSSIRFRRALTHCSRPFCSSPLCEFDALLFSRALAETGVMQPSTQQPNDGGHPS